MQKITFTLASGIVVQVEGDHETGVIQKAAFWSELPIECPVCKSPLRFGYSTPKTYQYYQLVCSGDTAGVRHYVNLGEKTGSHDLYFDRQKEWRIYIPGTPGEPLAGLPAAGESSGSRNAGTDVVAGGTDQASRNAVVGKVKNLIDVAKANSIQPAVDYADLAKLDVEQLKSAGVSIASTLQSAGISF